MSVQAPAAVVMVRPHSFSPNLKTAAGNALELRGHNGHVLALSARAEQSLTQDQKARIRQSATLLPIAIPTIEMAGGSVRCMLAGIHLSHR